MTALAARHVCIHADSDPVASVMHTKGDGRPSRKRCRYCGGALRVDRGLWGVFTWTGSGRYPLEDAHRTFTSRTVAEGWAARSNPEWVTRWIPD